MEINFDGHKMMKIIYNLVNIPSPTGFTDQILKQLEEFLVKLDLPAKRNNKGGLITTLPGKNGDAHRMITAHVDALGAMVKEIKANGRLKLALVGGSRWNHIEGEYCRIFSASGKTFSGTILMHQTSVHVYKDAGTAERNSDNMEVRIDEKVKSAEDVKKLGISVGDFVAFDPRAEITESGFIKSRHLDDKASPLESCYI